jgi:peptidoglycan/xylan/chitin deacetylase (PgdA/CDA1 family)
MPFAIAAERRDPVRPAAKPGGSKKAAKSKPCRHKHDARRAARKTRCNRARCPRKQAARRQRCKRRRFPVTAKLAAEGSYSSVVLGDGPRGYWRLGDASGTVARDETGAFAGTYTGGALLGRPGALAGDTNTAAGLDGVNDHVRVPDANGLDLTDTFTLEAWVKRSSTGGTRSIIDKGETSYSFRIQADGKLLLRKNAVATLTTSTTAIADTTTWHHVAAVKSPTTVKLYLDGQDVTGTVTQQTMANTPTALAIGASDGGSAYFLPATLDEVAIYPTALTPTRIQAHIAAAGTAGPPPPPPPPAGASTVVSLTFDDGQATQYQTKEMLKAHGMHATYFVNSDDVCTFDCPWDFEMPWDQIAALAADGNEIGGHTLEHVDLTDSSIPLAERRRQVCEDRTALIARGYDPVSFAYPYSNDDATARQLVQECGYTSGRTGGGTPGVPETIPPRDRYATHTAYLGPGEMTLSAMQDVILRNEQSGGGWTQFGFHGVCDNACTDGWVRPSSLNALLDWLAPRAARGTVVKTVREVIGGPAPPPPPPADTTPPDTAIASGPSGTVTATGASFAFTASETGATFQCRLDTASFAACTSPRAYTALAVGQHTFSVRATDAAGNVDATPATRTWTIQAPPPAPTVVSLTFDDSQATQYFQARTPLRSRGMRGTFFVNTGELCLTGCTGDYHMTWAQVRDLAADGNEIGGHTLNHVELTDPSLSLAEKRRQICGDRQNLVDQGLSPVSFAYPYGHRDATAISLVRECGYNSARIVGGADAKAETIPPPDPFQTRTPSFGDGELTLSVMQGAITRAEQSDGGWVQLVFHGMCDTACNEGWVRPSTFNALLDWLAPRAANGTVVKTVREVIGGPAPPPPNDTTPPDTSIASGPSGTVTATSASFAFTASESGATFQCSLDGAAFAACTSPRAYSALAAGQHTFSVRAGDAAGNVDPTPAIRAWTIAAAQTGSYSSVVLGDGPRGYWRLGDASGTVARDETGAFAGTYTGGALLGRPGALAGDTNTAAGLDGVNDHVRVPDANGLDLTDTFTLEAWVKRSSTGGTRSIIDKGETSYSFRIQADGKLLLRKNAVATLTTSTTAIADTTTWHHVAAVKSPTTVKLYLDGQDVTGTVTQQTMANTPTALAIGASDGGSAYFLPATLDEVAIYPTALTPTRIQAHIAAAGGG